MNNPLFIISFVITTGISIYGLSSDYNLKKATRHALVAFIIAYMARLNLPFASFILVGLITYHHLL